MFWAWLLGPLGAILAIPLTLMCKAILVDVDAQARWADVLLRASAKDPDPTAPTKKSRRRAGHTPPAPPSRSRHQPDRAGRRPTSR